MRPQTPILAFSTLAAAAASPKRGLVYVPNTQWPQDDQIWTRPGSSLSWYYNYKSTPSPAFSGVPQVDFEFVPMLWGTVTGTSFLDGVNSLIEGGRNISHVLGFNEPDGSSSTGGSGIAPAAAAEVWVKNIEPLAEKGVKLGLPACTGGRGGIPWLQQFLGNCSEIVSRGTEERNCTYDFVNIHWYGNFEGLASHMGSYSAAFPNVTQWITEYNYNDQDLATTQKFFNTSAEYFDRLESVGRYSFFGSFRSKVSNVGQDAVMLSNDGQLTDIGSWYLGGKATGVSPTSAASEDSRPPSSLAFLAAIIGVLILLR